MRLAVSVFGFVVLAVEWGADEYEAPCSLDGGVTSSYPIQVTGTYGEPEPYWPDED